MADLLKPTDSMGTEMSTEIRIEDIMNLLPHRYPFLLVDRVVEYSAPDYIHAFKNVTINEPFFNGHFPGNPVMPGVLLIEALAQTGAILTYISVQTTPKDNIFFLASMDNVKFKKPVKPGDQVHLQVKLVNCKGPFRKFVGEALVDNKVVCSAEILGVMSKVES